MKVEEINRKAMENQINRREVNQSALVIEEITARKEQSDKASNSVMAPINNPSS